MFSVFYDIEFIPYFSVVIFLLGLCLGSFFNVCIWRIPRNESIILPPSHCPNCDKKILWFDNLPVISHIILGGKCRWCQKKISSIYIAVELLTATLFVIDYLRVVEQGLPLSTLLSYFTATALFVIGSFIDFKHRIIPNKVTYVVIIFSLVMAFIFPGYTQKEGNFSGLLNSFLGALTGGGIFAIFSIIGSKIYKKEVLGFGDVKFVAAMGACFGFNIVFYIFVIFISSLLGLFFGIILILSGRKGFDSEIQFGPFLAIAGYLWILTGPELIDFYCRIMSISQ